MATLREIRRRITSIKNIEQVTDAMRVVAAARLRRAQENITATRPYADKLNTILGHLISQMDTEEQALTHPLLETRENSNMSVLSPFLVTVAYAVVSIVMLPAQPHNRYNTTKKVART